MATRAERLDALQKALDNYTSKEKKRIENEVTFLKAVLKGRTGQDTVSRAVDTINEVAYKDMATYLFGDAKVSFGGSTSDSWPEGDTVPSSNAYPASASQDSGDTQPPVLKHVVGWNKGAGPVDLIVTLADDETGQFLSVPAAAAYRKMKKAAAADGIKLSINLGFRTNEQQEALWIQFGKDPARVAPPKHSNHQMGVCADIHVGSATSPTCLWLIANAGKYKFQHTVWPSEPWHWEYIP